MSKSKQRKQTTYSASEARANFYNILKDVSSGLVTYEITHRGEQPVVMISKDEFESWQETLDIISQPTELTAIRKAKKEKKLVSHKEVLKELGLDD